MKLSAVQIKKIDDALKNQGLFYEDVRNEVTDHIATGFEERGIDGDSFDEVLGQYMNSHRIVKLLAVAKSRQEYTDNQYHRAFLQKFITARGMLILSAAFLCVWTLGKLSWASDLLLTGFLFIMLWAMFGLNGMESARQAFMKRLYGEVKLYYLIAVVLLALIGHFYTGSEIFSYAKSIVMSFAFTGYYFIYLINLEYKRKRCLNFQ